MGRSFIGALESVAIFAAFGIFLLVLFSTQPDFSISTLREPTRTSQVVDSVRPELKSSDRQPLNAGALELQPSTSPRTSSQTRASDAAEAAGPLVSIESSEAPSVNTQEKSDRRIPAFSSSVLPEQTARTLQPELKKEQSKSAGTPTLNAGGIQVSETSAPPDPNPRGVGNVAASEPEKQSESVKSETAGTHGNVDERTPAFSIPPTPAPARTRQPVEAQQAQTLDLRYSNTCNVAPADPKPNRVRSGGKLYRNTEEKRGDKAWRRFTPDPVEPSPSKNGRKYVFRNHMGTTLSLSVSVNGDQRTYSLPIDGIRDGWPNDLAHFPTTPALSFGNKST